MGRKSRKGNAKTVIGYIRVSTDEQALGPEAQRATIESWCKENGCELACVFEDIGISGGTDLSRRPGLVEALGALKAHGAGVLIVAKRDRLARDVLVAATVERMARRNGAEIVSADGVGNGDGPADEFMRTVIDGAAQYERALISARTRSALAVKRTRGEKTGGSVPFGYALGADGVHLVEEPREQEIIRIVQRLRSRGLSIRKIAEQLNGMSCPARGRKWHKTSVARLLDRAA